MQENHKYNIYMFIATIFFGMTYVLTKICLNYWTEFHIISFRFLIAFIVSLIFLYKKIFPIKIKEFIYSLILSIILFLVFITMTIGVKYTTATNASFLISLSVIFIPFFSWIFNKEKPKKSIFIVLIIVLIGIILLTLDKNLEFHIGDILCLICSLLFSFHIIITEKLVKTNNPITLGVLQFGGVVLEKVRMSPKGFGFDARNEKFVNMIESGIIDPAKVTRAAIQNSTSVASLLLTTEVVIANKKEEEKAPMGAGGMMPGMM